MESAITASWIRIENWLAQLAPTTFVALAPPATRAALEAVQVETGEPLPEALTDCLLRHDGTGFAALLPPFWCLLDTSGIVESHRTAVRLNAEVFGDATEDDRDGDDGLWWHRQWIPFATDGAANHLVLDQRPHRRTGRIGNADHETGCLFGTQPLWESLPALLEATATALETGEPLDGCLPLVAGGELRWEVL
ncbi:MULTISPECIES: SMI1/KNR4 family protein [unclassified Streptomyces]|uniref:SMI1/KNR4 family protein n=1 Tax=unclassified Streptomyces TaxID=2593676 RepID=UPI003322B916